jgi:hypothetical protein
MTSSDAVDGATSAMSRRRDQAGDVVVWTVKCRHECEAQRAERLAGLAYDQQSRLWQSQSVSLVSCR